MFLLKFTFFMIWSKDLEESNFENIHECAKHYFAENLF